MLVVVIIVVLMVARRLWSVVVGIVAAVTATVGINIKGSMCHIYKKANRADL